MHVINYFKLKRVNTASIQHKLEHKSSKVQGADHTPFH